MLDVIDSVVGGEWSYAEEELTPALKGSIAPDWAFGD